MRKEVENWGGKDTPFQRVGCEPILWSQPRIWHELMLMEVRTDSRSVDWHSPTQTGTGPLQDIAEGHLGFFGYLFIVKALLDFLGFDVCDFEDHEAFADFRWRKLYDDRVHPHDAILEMVRRLAEFTAEAEVGNV
jgi:hypothetical protein